MATSSGLGIRLPGSIEGGHWNASREVSRLRFTSLNTGRSSSLSMSIASLLLLPELESLGMVLGVAVAIGVAALDKKAKKPGMAGSPRTATSALKSTFGGDVLAAGPGAGNLACGARFFFSALWVTNCVSSWICNAFVSR